MVGSKPAMRAVAVVAMAALIPLCLGASDLANRPGVTLDPQRPSVAFAPGNATLVISEPIRLVRDVASISTFVVADGAPSTDVAFDGGISEVDGVCGFVKEGEGHLRVSGEMRVSGFITVWEGTLDLSAARPAVPLRIHLLGNAKLVPPAEDGTKIELYLDGVKAAAGSWGPVGSASAGKSAHDSPNLLAVTQVADTGPSRRERWQGLKYGIFSHYVWNGYGMSAGMPNVDGSRASSIDDLADRFDVANYVNQLVEIGAQYVVFTAWHSGTCPLYPSKAMDKWAPGRPDSPQRDLLGDVLDECHRRGIRPFFYCHPFQPVAEPHNDWINDLFAELVDRYGDRLDGLWLDENFQDCTQDKVVDYRRLMQTIKDRNPDLVLTHNNGGFQSYGVDEGVQEVQWEFHEGRMASVYQIFNQTAKSPEDMLVTTIIQAAANTMGGGIQWSIDAHGSAGSNPGGLDASARPILDGFVKLFKPIAESVCETRPSSSYPPPFQGTVVCLSGLRWGVATRSADDRKEYLHVLKAPGDRSLFLPPPADGKVFGNARLLEGGGSLAMTQNDRGLELTLPDDVTWKSPVTVIVMDVLAPGGVGLVNDSSRSVNYQGASWTSHRSDSGGEFRGDCHRTTADGDSFSFTFEGTDVSWISSMGPGNGQVEISIDGKPQGIVDLSKGQGSFQTVFSRSGLQRGKHTLTGVKRGGGLITVDAFQVSDLINDADSEVMFSQTTRHGATGAQLEGPWEPRGASWINGQKFTFTFHGVAVEVQGGSAHGSGDLVLTLNGKEHSTVHCHGGQTSRTLVNITGLSNTLHTLVGHYTNPHPAGFISALDGFIVTRPDYWSRQTRRGLGEIGDDIHVSSLKNAIGSLSFRGSGVEVYSTRDAESRTVHYTLDGGGSSLWVGLNHYWPTVMPRATVFRYPNLFPGEYTVSFINAANSTGVNFDRVRLGVDAVRVFKGESSSSSTLFWGADGRGGSGKWEVGGVENWFDGLKPVRWDDFGASDHRAVFAGSGGEIHVQSPVRVNRMAFLSDGFRLTGERMELTGKGPHFRVDRGAKVVILSPVLLADGLTLAGGTYGMNSHPSLVEGGGSIEILSAR